MISQNTVPKLLFALLATSLSITSHCMLRNAMTAIKQNPGATLFTVGLCAQAVALQYENIQERMNAIKIAVAATYDIPDTPPAVTNYVHNLMRQCGCSQALIKNTFIKERIGKRVGFGASSDGGLAEEAYNFIFIPTKKIPLVAHLPDPDYIPTKRKELIIPPALRHEIGHLHNLDFETQATANEAIICIAPPLQAVVSSHLLRNAKSPWSFAAATAMLIPGWWLIKKCKTLSAHLLKVHGEYNAERFAMAHTTNPDECAAYAQHFNSRHKKLVQTMPQQSKDFLGEKLEQQLGSKEIARRVQIGALNAASFLAGRVHPSDLWRAHEWQKREKELREQPTQA